MAGFADLLAVMAALNKEAAKTPAIIDRVAGTVPSVAPVRGEGSTIIPEVVEPSRVNQILGQMRAVNAGAAEAMDSLETLSIRADEVTADVQIKISKALSLILDPGKGEGVSGHFDKDTGQFLGGGLSFERARDFAERYNELEALGNTKLNAFERFYLNQSKNMTVDQFRREFGNKLGDLKTLAKQLREYIDAMARAGDQPRGTSSGTLGKLPARSSSTVSLAVLRWSGSLPR